MNVINQITNALKGMHIFPNKQNKTKKPTENSLSFADQTIFMCELMISVYTGTIRE